MIRLHPWSSYHANALAQPDALVTPHAAYLALGHDAPSRVRAYRALFAEALSDDLLSDIRRYLQQQRALGTGRFQAKVEAELRRFVGVRPVGRPRKNSGKCL